MELFALSHAISEATRLEQDIASANERAGIAEQKAGEANERAANIESNNLVLQKELQPRIITLTQITNFIFLTEKIINVPVKISFASGRNETVNFAYQLRDMLNRAGFMPETNAGTWGINPDATHIWRRTRAGDTNWPSVYLYVYGTNGCFNSRFFAYEFTNKFARPIVNINDPETVGCAILFVLKQIGINTEEGSNSEIVKPNEFEFYIMDKAN
jgi:hypothetical protein